MMTIAPVLQLSACAALVAASLWALRRRAGTGDTYRFLFFFALASLLTGALLVWGHFVEFWVAWYRGSLYETDSATAVAGWPGDVRLIIGCSLLWLFPGAALFRSVGGRPLVAGLLGCAAAFPLLAFLLLWRMC